MRLLPVRADHAGGLAAGEEFQPDQGRGRRAYGRQSLPLHDLFPDPEGDHACRIRDAHRVRLRQRAEAHMNKHVNNVTPEITDLSRRSFLVGTAATGLVLGYAGVPGIGSALAAAPANFEPSVWYALSPDRLVTVTCGKADMGQHIASTMAQIVCEELGAKWSDMRVNLASND